MVKTLSDAAKLRTKTPRVSYLTNGVSFCGAVMKGGALALSLILHLGMILILFALLPAFALAFFCENNKVITSGL